MLPYRKCTNSLENAIQQIFVEVSELSDAEAKTRMMSISTRCVSIEDEIMRLEKVRAMHLNITQVSQDQGNMFCVTLNETLDMKTVETRMLLVINAVYFALRFTADEYAFNTIEFGKP